MAKYGNYGEMAKAIIKENKYMVIATSDKSGRPWANPVFYAYDDKYDFYFLSAIDSVHAKNIIANFKVSIVIFDSKQKVGSSEAVQIEGSASIVKKENLERVIRIYSENLFPSSKMEHTERYNPKDYDEPSEFRFFKVTPAKIYVTGVDRRVEVDLSE